MKVLVNARPLVVIEAKAPVQRAVSQLDGALRVHTPLTHLRSPMQSAALLHDSPAADRLESLVVASVPHAASAAKAINMSGRGGI